LTALDVKIAHVERVILDVLTARFDGVAHEDGEHLVGFDGVVLVHLHAEELAGGGIHRRVEELLGVHFTETLESLDLHAPLPDLHDLGKDLRDAEDGMDFGMIALAFDDLEEGLILRGETAHIETELAETDEELGDGVGLVDLDEAGAAAGAIGLATCSTFAIENDGTAPEEMKIGFSAAKSRNSDSPRK
jgi:hypothetical protein